MSLMKKISQRAKCFSFNAHREDRRLLKVGRQ